MFEEFDPLLTGNLIPYDANAVQKFRLDRASEEKMAPARPWLSDGERMSESVAMPRFSPASVFFHGQRIQAGCAAAVLAIAVLAGGRVCPAQSQSEAPDPAQAQPQPSTQAQPQPPAQPEVKPAPPTPIAIQKVKLGEDDPWNPAWDLMIEKALPRNLVSRRRAAAVRPLCPRYGSMSRGNRRAFWAYFFQALAGAEAGLKPTADVRHKDPEVAVVDTVTHHIVRQEGLLQLTYMDSVRYGCNFNWEQDKDLPVHDPAKTILQPRNNLLCGIRIVENQLIRQHKPLLTDSSYWVTLRPDYASFKMFLRQMANVPAACGSSLRKPASEKHSLAAADEAQKTAPHPAEPASETDPAIEPDPAIDPAGSAGADPPSRSPISGSAGPR